MGTPISPKPLGSPAVGVTSEREQREAQVAMMSPVSRAPPQMTTPATCFWMAELVASSPQMAGATPPASMTMTSPGWAWSMASTGLAQSPG